MKTAKSSAMRLRRLTAVSLFCALAYICLFFLKLKVSFLTFDLKDAIIAIGSMYFGPMAAAVMPAAVSLLEFLTISDTGIYGLIMNFLSSFTFCFVASLIYKLRKNISGAMIALASAVTCTVAVMIGANLVITPYYLGVETSELVGMIPVLLLPFNLIKGLVNASVVMLLYKPFSTALKSAGVLRSADDESTVGTAGASKRLIITVAAVAVLVLALSLAVLFFVFHADFFI